MLPVAVRGSKTLSAGLSCQIFAVECSRCHLVDYIREI